MSEMDFGELLTEGIRHICACENKQLQIVQDELGYAAGHKGGSMVRYWRQGHWPAKPSDVETLARTIVQRGRVSRAWLERFLGSANFPNAVGLCDQLFPNLRDQSLPAPLTDLIGRERELADVMDRLQNSRVRLLTLTGPPGVGKTRVALHLATALRATFEDGVVFVPLASTRDPELVMSVIAGAVGLMDNDGQALKARLISFLRNRALLLVLDNFEQVIAAAFRVAELLSTAPRLRVLVTSREPLHIYGEHEYLVPPLQLPVAGDPIRLEVFTHIPAIQLFVERATAANPSFRIGPENAATVAAICTRLDGLPLAIELAASRSKRLTPDRLLAQLTDRLTLLISGPRDWPARQQTLQAAIDWSYALLSPAEQRLFRRLGVFQGGCTLEAVEAVCGPSVSQSLAVEVLPLLENLQDKNLVHSVPSNSQQDEFRYAMLETILEYAGHKLHESGEAEEAGRRHAEWCLKLAEHASQHLRGRDQLLWLDRLEQEVNNFRKALSWCVEHPAHVEIGLRLGIALYWFWHMHCRHGEGGDWLDRLLAIDLQIDGSRAARQVRARAMRAASVMHALQLNSSRAVDLARESLELFRDIDDSADVISARIALSLATYWNGDLDQSVALAEELLPVCRANGDHFYEAQLLDAILGEVAFIQGDYARAANLHEQSLALRRTFPDTDGLTWTLFLLGRNLHALGDTTRARALYEESRGLWQQLGHRRWSADVLDKLGTLACAQGDFAQAKTCLEESLAVAGRFGDSDRAVCALCDLAMLACEENDVAQAQTYLRKVAGLIQEPICAPLHSKFFLTAARLALTTGDLEYAARLAGAAEAAPKYLNARLGMFNPAEYDSLQTAIRTAVGTHRFDQLRTAGVSMSFESALAYATQTS